MTLIVALKGKLTDTSNEEAIVMASDTQVSSDTKSSMQKTFPMESMPMLVGGAGSLSLSRHIIYGLNRMSRSFQVKVKGKMSCDDFDYFVNSDIEPYLRKTVKLHSDAVEQSGLGLILSFSDSTHVRIYEVQSDGIPVRMDHNPGYCCIGSGFATGGNLLIKQFYTPGSSLIHLMTLASYMIFQLSEVDPSVGGTIQMKLNFGGKIINPKDDLERHNVQLRSEIMREVWHLLESQPVDFEERFNKALKKGLLIRMI